MKQGGGEKGEKNIGRSSTEESNIDYIAQRKNIERLI